MRVLVTGATGFIGSHTVAELVRQGHDVSLFVRTPERVSVALDPLGISGCPFTVGDVTDAAAVEAAMRGCDAVVHCGSVFSLNSRKKAVVRHTNVVGAEVVIGTANRLGLDPIVQVSSIAALFPPGGRVLTTHSPANEPRGAYFGSKADSDRVARRYQEAGAPVVITYPSVVLGAHDPHLGEVASSLVNILKGRVPAVPTGGFPIVDVATVAKVHAAVMSPGKGPRRYIVSGTYFPVAEMIGLIGEVTGRRLRVATVPGWTLVPVAWLADAVQRVLPFRIPIDIQSFYLTVWDPHCDDSETTGELGITYPNVRDALVETIEWLARTGRLSAKEAGVLAA
jgi:dihydroflavonol-4-reductase